MRVKQLGSRPGEREGRDGWRTKAKKHVPLDSEVLFFISLFSTKSTSFKGCITTIDPFAKQGDILLAILLIANRRGGIGKPLSDLSLCDTGIGETQGCDSQGNLNAQGGAYLPTCCFLTVFTMNRRVALARTLALALNTQSHRVHYIPLPRTCPRPRGDGGIPWISST